MTTTTLASRSTSVAPINWEWLWSPYAESDYTAVLDQISADDIILDIGAGDLRLARRMADKAEKVYAIEIQSGLIEGIFPFNLEVFIGDARLQPFPPDINTAVLLLRHCNHFGLYWDKLTAVGCQRLITNARWGVGVETIDMTIPRLPFEAMGLGWYACQNGHTGFKNGPPQQLTTEMLDSVTEVAFCPACQTN